MTAIDRYLRHSVVIVRDALGSEDDYGQPSRTPTDIETVDALVQPLPSIGGEEEDLTHGAGAEVSDHRIFMRLTDVNTGDRIRHDSQEYEINTVRNAAGQDHHLEILARLVAPVEVS